MRSLYVALILLLASPAAAQDLPALFRQGMEATAAGEHDTAIAAFRKMLVADPSLVRVRLELARAFHLMGEDRLAKRHFKAVLADNPPAPVAANVRRFLASIRARCRWDMQAGFALAPDTNIGTGSDERTIYIDIGEARMDRRPDYSAVGVGRACRRSWRAQTPIPGIWTDKIPHAGASA